MDMQIDATEIRFLQDEVAKTIVSLGGYWRPLSGLARVLEEIGELGELLDGRRYTNEDLAAELADVFVITTCLANQYNADLANEYRARADNLKTSPIIDTSGALTSLHIGLCNLTHQAGKLARLINYYEGDKPPKKNEEISNITMEVANIHDCLMDIASVARLDLGAAIRTKLDVISKRDVGRFQAHWDPTTAASLEAFRLLMETTPCIFANQAKVWGAPDYEVRLSLRENARRFGAVLSRFCKMARHEGLDGFVIAMTCNQLFDGTEGLSKTFCQLLFALGDLNEERGNTNCMRRDIQHSSWRFSYDEVTFFITTFAPFYGERHPRNSKSATHAFIFMQPEFSFDVNGVHKDNPRREAIKQCIRENFVRKSNGYSVDLVEQPIEALKYIKPTESKGEPVQWWPR